MMLVSTTSWRSTNSFTRSERKRASSGTSISTAGRARRRDNRSAVDDPQRPGGVRAVRRTLAAFSRRHVEEVEERDLTVPDAIRVLDGDGAGLDELGHLCELEGLGLADGGSGALAPRSPRGGSCPIRAGR